MVGIPASRAHVFLNRVHFLRRKQIRCDGSSCNSARRRPLWSQVSECGCSDTLAILGTRFVAFGGLLCYACVPCWRASGAPQVAIRVPPFPIGSSVWPLWKLAKSKTYW